MRFLKRKKWIILILLIGLFLYRGGYLNSILGKITSSGYELSETITSVSDTVLSDISGTSINKPPFNASDIPAGTEAYVEINNNKPFFTKDDLTTEAYESYGSLDSLGRCTVTTACVGEEIMPTEKRGEIGMVKPTGWNQEKYEGYVDSNPPYLYNRCHLIGFQLTGENANTKNLITGTRYLNIEGMLDHENLVADYVKSTGNHVLYRVTPIFEGTDLLARGVLMEGYSVEDNGKGVCFCIFARNIQPGIKLDYKTGESEIASVDSSSTSKDYITADGIELIPEEEVPLALTAEAQHKEDIWYEACLDMFRQVNEYRAQNGVPELYWSEQLYQDAVIRVNESTYCWSHTRPDGTPWWSVDPDHNYGENLACKYQDNTAAMQGWIASPSHNANMLKSFYKYGGISICQDKNGFLYWALELGI